MSKEIGAILRKTRLANRLTQEEVARRIGAAPSSLTDWETGRRHPSAKSIAALAALYDMPLHYLMGEYEPAKKLEGELRSVGERLKALRLRDGLTRTQVANWMGLAEISVRRAEANEQEFPAWRIPTLARLFRCSIDFILTGKEDSHVAALHRAIRANAPHAQLLAMVSSYE